MKIGPILAALGGGLAGLGAAGGLGGGASGALGGLAGMSPLLALLLQKKKDKNNVVVPGSPPGPINITQNPMLRQMGGGMMVPPGVQAPPFGTMRPTGMY